ncbi:MAG: hypothetical protein IPJ16_04915 [Bacteroidales bacterium]|nr:hypothetical protein [Bacteroidales bacterium]
MRQIYGLIIAASLIFSGCSKKNSPETPVSFSGIYPHLAYYNNEGECGTGAVVPWAGKLWVITYGPHLPFGSSDKLYEISEDFVRQIRSESVGGTPANRMIHKESNQLFIGPYVIDKEKNVRVISPSVMPGRLTGNARHLTDPSGKIYYATMEEGLYEVDVNSLAVSCLFRDGNVKSESDNPTAQFPLSLLKGAHGKGVYSGQGVLIYSNNGELSDKAQTQFDIESGSLNEWDGKEWNIVRRNQFVEVTGPGGIYGNPDPAADPIWVTGWDHKSLLVGVRDIKGWRFYRLPKASHSYDGAHGWNTEWPRIRDIGIPGNPFYLMTMHGMFWRFPATFTSANSSGIRPMSAFLKVIGDFCRWNNLLVFGCDDSANKEFLNKRGEKGTIEGPGQSNSNLWFISPDKPGQLGPTTAEGAVWVSENIKADEYSEPFIFGGWEHRSLWLKNEGKQTVNFTLETDLNGSDTWKSLRKISIKPDESLLVPFEAADKGEWIRLFADRPTKVTAQFWFSGSDSRSDIPALIFNGLTDAEKLSSTGGLIWGMGGNSHKLGVLSGTLSDSSFTESGYYELDSLMNLEKKENAEAARLIRDKVSIPHNVVTIDSASVVIDDDQGRRWRLPKGKREFTNLTNNSLLRICREVATERDLFNCSGTFYELPAENADGFAKIRPVSSHNFRIHDYASYRGMLIMTGIDINNNEVNNHIVRSVDGKAAVWAGTIDDLWLMGKPTGEGGPWYNTIVKSGIPSDAYLIGFYDKRRLQLSHHSGEKVKFRIEADPVGNGHWMKYSEVVVNPGETYRFEFPAAFQARWIRFIAGNDCIASAVLKYE